MKKFERLTEFLAWLSTDPEGDKFASRTYDIMAKKLAGTLKADDQDKLDKYLEPFLPDPRKRKVIWDAMSDSCALKYALDNEQSGNVKASFSGFANEWFHPTTAHSPSH